MLPCAQEGVWRVRHRECTNCLPFPLSRLLQTALSPQSVLFFPSSGPSSPSSVYNWWNLESDFPVPVPIRTRKIRQPSCHCPVLLLARASLAQWIPDPWIPYVWTRPASCFLRDIFLSVPVPCCLSSRSSDCRFLFDSFLYCCLCQPQLQAQLILSEHNIHRKMHKT